MKEDITRLFDKITPIRSDDEIIANVIGKAENMEEKNTKKSKGLRKPLIAACAAVTVLAVGVTAAATGLIDFNALFGGRISAHNENVNDALLAKVSDVVINSDSDEYTLELGGVISTGNFLAGSFDIVRTDDTPVVDHMYTPEMEGRFDSNEWWTSLYDADGNSVDAAPGDSLEHYLGFVINDEGNISCNFHFNSKELVSLAEKAEFTFSADWLKHEGARPINMTLAFDYEASDEALRTKSIVADGKTIPLETTTAKVIDSKFGCLSGTFTLEYELHNEDYNFDYPTALILNDGTEMPICLCSLTSYQYTDLGIGVETINFVYSSELDGNITAFDIDDIKGITMNGTVFDLA